MIVLRRIRDWLRQFPKVHRAIRSVWIPPRRIHQHLYFDGILPVEVAPGVGFKLQCEGEFVENEIFWRGFGTGWEGKSLRIWGELASSSEHVLDIGANTGIYSLFTKAVRPTSRVIALEPSPRVFRKLQRNIALNEFDIVCLDVAASDNSGSAIFYDVPTEHQYIGSLERQSGGTVETRVRVAKVDDLLPEIGMNGLDLVKIDVERHEPAVLRGMRSSLERWKPAILVEILTAKVERGIREAVAGLGYHMAPIGPKDSPDPIADARNYLIAQAEILETMPPDIRNAEVAVDL